MTHRPTIDKELLRDLAEERAAIIEEAFGVTRAEAEDRAATGLGFGNWAELARYLEDEK